MSDILFKTDDYIFSYRVGGFLIHNGKVLRRFIWHDRIHAKAMYRMTVKVFGAENIANPFCF